MSVLSWAQLSVRCQHITPQFVWLSDFNEHHHMCHQISMSTDITSLLYSVSLQHPPVSSKIADGMVWDPKVGFTIPYGPYTAFNMISCITVVKGRKVKSMYFPKRQSESVVFLSNPFKNKCVDFFLSWAFHILNICFQFTAHVLENVKITPDRIKVLVGDTLILNCTGETTFNGRIDFIWDFPKRKVSNAFTVYAVLLFVKRTLTG